MQKVRSNSNPTGFTNLRDVTVLWHGWLKKLGRFSKRWRRRYFVFVAIAGGRRELRHYDTYREVPVLLVSTPKGVIGVTDATGICCLLPPSPLAAAAAGAVSIATTGSGKKAAKFKRSDGNDAGLDANDQRFAVVTPLHVSLLAFHNGSEWSGASESQQGLSLLAALSAFYPAIDVLHAGWMTKKRERTGHSPKSIISYWKRHFFVFLASGDLLYFRDESLNELQGRVDVRHAPTVRVTGERVVEEKRKESLFKFASKLSALERQACLVWIATPPSKMFVLKLQDDGSDSGAKRLELSPVAKKWLSLLMKGHAETKYTQLEQCAASGKYENSVEIISAIRAGIPDELRGQLWKGFSGAIDVQRRAEMTRSIRRVAKITSFRQQSAKRIARTGSMSTTELPSLFEELAAPIDVDARDSPGNRVLYARLSALALRETQLAVVDGAELAVVDGAELALPTRPNRTESDTSVQLERASEWTDRESFMVPRSAMDPDDDDTEDDDEAASATRTSARNTLKQLVKGRLGDYVYPSDASSADWELSARRRLLVATTRFNPYSHPCPWRVSCLLLAYLEEESAFWVINSVTDVMLPGYFHGYRPALQIDVSAFQALLESRVPALSAHLKALSVPVDRLVEKWFLSLFTSSCVPLPTVLRIWDAFFSQGLRVLFGVGVALFLLAEEKLFHATSRSDVDECLRATETSCIDANALFALVFKDDLHISWLTGDHLEKLRSTHRQRVLETVAQNVEHFNDKLSVLTQIEDVCARCSLVAERLLGSAKQTDAARGLEPQWLQQQQPETDDNDLDDDSIECSLRALNMQLKSLVEATTSLAAELSVRQSKWLALSSQLKACPLGKLPSADLQSWLSQVREGKISGAGHDSWIASATDELAYVSATQLMDASDLFVETNDVGDRAWSCLVSTREDLQPSHAFRSEVLLYALVSAVKALCATRLECLSASYRFMWHGGRWIESAIEYPLPSSVMQNDERAQRARRLQRSHTNVSSSFTPIGNHRKARARDDSDLTRHTIVEDPRARRESLVGASKPKPTSALAFDFAPFDDALDDDTGLLSPAISTRGSLFAASPAATAAPSPRILNVSDRTRGLSGLSNALDTPTSNKRAMDELAREFRVSGELLHVAHTKFMASLSKYIRLESRNRAWPLRERAFVLEDDLQQEMKDMERDVLGSQWLDRS